MDLVSEMKRLTEHITLLEERLARLELAHGPVQPRPSLGAHNGLVSRRVSGTGSSWDMRPLGRDEGSGGVRLMKSTAKAVASNNKALQK